MDKAFAGVSGVALGAYLIAVVLKGNGKQLVTETSKDWQYLEFLAAVYILYLLHKSNFGGEVMDLIITSAIIAVVIKMMASSNTDFTGTLTKFAEGKISMTEAAFAWLGLASPKKG